MTYDREALKRCRARKGIAVFEITRATGLRQGTIYAIEKGRVAPRADTIAKLCNVLGVSPLEFFRKEPAA